MAITKRRGDPITCKLGSFEYQGPQRALYFLFYVYQGTGLAAFKYTATRSYTVPVKYTWTTISLNWSVGLSLTGQSISLGYANAAIIIATDPDWKNQLLLRVWSNEVYFNA